MFWLEEAGLPMTGANIARAMQLSPPTVHEMIGRLIEDGYVERNPNKSLTFTESGREHASHIVRRHRMIERFLTDVLGIPWDEVHEEAERIEHAMSPVLEERMRAAIGDATTCPHGHPIVEGDPRAGLAAGRRRGRRRRHRPALRERGRGAAPLPQSRRPRPGPRGQGRELRRGRRHDRLRRRQPRGQPQRRRDRLGPRRPGAAAARGDPRAARPLQRPLRPLGSAGLGAATRDSGRSRSGLRSARRCRRRGSVVTITSFDARSCPRSPSRRSPCAVGDEQRPHRFDFAVAPDPGLEHPVAGSCRTSASCRVAALSPFADDLGGDAGRLAGGEGRAPGRRCRPPPLPIA